MKSKEVEKRWGRRDSKSCWEKEEMVHDRDKTDRQTERGRMREKDRGEIDR